MAQEAEKKEPELYKAKGEIKKVGDLEIYVYGKGPNAIIVFYDVYGWHNLTSDDKLDDCPTPKSHNTFEFYDRVADAIGTDKIQIIMPNYLRDAPLTRKPDWSKFGEWWNTVGNPDKIIKEFTTTVLPFAHKECGVKLFAVCGQCWGGNLCFKGIFAYLSFSMLLVIQYIGLFC